MKITKRETILLTFLMVLLVGCGVYFLLFAPLRDRLDEQKTRYQELETQKTNVELLLARPDSTGNYQEQLGQAQQNYDSFYSVLNSYTIDNILSDLMDEQQLQVTKMKISPYLPVLEAEATQATEQTVQPADGAEVAEAAQNLLLKCSVDLEGGGNFASIMKFVDALNAKSFCVSVRDLKIDYRSETNLITLETKFSCSVDIYGVATPEGVTFT